MDNIEALEYHDLVQVADPHLSPDGDTVTFVRKVPDGDEEYEATVYLVSTDGGDPQNEEVSRLDGARQGTNDFDDIGYRGPAPPEGDGPHTYRFTVYAVETTLELTAGAERGALDDALDESTIGSGRLSGEYER